MPRVFDPFTQADRSLARSADGLGIGLSLAHRIVVLHGGTIEAQSPPHDADRGTELIVRRGRTPTPAEIDATATSDRGAVHADEKGRRLLVVDDNMPASA